MVFGKAARPRHRHHTLYRGCEGRGVFGREDVHENGGQQEDTKHRLVGFPCFEEESNVLGFRGLERGPFATRATLLLSARWLFWSSPNPPGSQPRKSSMRKVGFRCQGGMKRLITIDAKMTRFQKEPQTTGSILHDVPFGAKVGDLERFLVGDDGALGALVTVEEVDKLEVALLFGEIELFGELAHEVIGR